MASLSRSGWAVAVLSIAAFLSSPVEPAAAKITKTAAPAVKTVAKSRARTAARAAAVSVPVVEKDAAIVVDGATGRVLYARNSDEPRKPASLTKMMTLYLLFEQLHEGNLTLTSKLTASKHAASMEPTKLGVMPGDKVDVETAIKAIAVLSANDVAVMIAEAIGKTEDEFGLLMTAKARALGMTRSNFHNASGLPDPLQVTSAHDMALLGRHLAYDFPQYYGYFATPSFSYDGRIYETHDHLLGAFDGVDGIKTGYTRASGFNLVTSAVRNKKHVVGVVMGGMSWVSRDQEMVRLLSQAFDFAQQNPTMLADADPPWRGGKGPGGNPFVARPAGTANVLVASLNPSSAPAAIKAVTLPPPVAEATPRPLTKPPAPAAVPTPVVTAPPKPLTLSPTPVVVAAAQPAAKPLVTPPLPAPVPAVTAQPKPLTLSPAPVVVAAAEPEPKPAPALPHLKAPVPKPVVIAAVKPVAEKALPVENPSPKEQAPAPIVVAAAKPAVEKPVAVEPPAPKAKAPAPVIMAANTAPTTAVNLPIPPFAAKVSVPDKFRIPMALPVDEEIKAGVVLVSVSTPAAKDRAPARVFQGDMTGLSVIFNAVNRQSRESAPADRKAKAAVPASNPPAKAAPANNQAIAAADPGNSTASASPPPVNHQGVAATSAKHWLVQIGAFPSEPLAQAGLASYAKLNEESLAQAERMIVPFSSLNGHTIYRARFGPFAEGEARRICSSLAQHGKQCFATAAN